MSSHTTHYAFPHHPRHHSELSPFCFAITRKKLDDFRNYEHDDRPGTKPTVLAAVASGTSVSATPLACMPMSQLCSHQPQSRKSIRLEGLRFVQALSLSAERLPYLTWDFGRAIVWWTIPLTDIQSSVTFERGWIWEKHLLERLLKCIFGCQVSSFVLELQFQWQLQRFQGHRAALPVTSCRESASTFGRCRPAGHSPLNSPYNSLSKTL